MQGCFYCGERMRRSNRYRLGRMARSADHLTPRSRGGSSFELDGNIVYCHRKCNEDKGNRTLEEYRAIIADRKGIPVEQFKFPGEKFQEG